MRTVSATALAGEGVFSLQCGLDRVVFCIDKGPQDPNGISLGAFRFECFFGVVFEVAFLRVWWPTWPQHGSNLDPRGLQNQENSIKKGIICWTLFLIDFLLILAASWVDFWWILGAKLRVKLSTKSTLTGNTEKSDFLIFAQAKTPKLKFSGGQLRVKIDPRSIEIQVEIWSAS